MYLSLVLVCLPLSILYQRYLYFRRMNIPLETSEYFKYAFTSVYVDIMFFVSWILEKLGICDQVRLIRTSLKIGVFQTDRELHIRDEQFDNVPVRIYEPKHPSSGPRRCLVYIHGGAGMLGTINAYAATCRHLALKTGTMVVDIGYRLAPEHPHPAQFEDCMSAVTHFLKEAENYGVDPNRVILAGDSSGGTLVSLVCHRLVTRKDTPRVRAQLLIYPPYQSVDLTLPSYQQNFFGPVLLGKRVFELAARFFNEEAADVSGFMKNAHVPDYFSVKYRKWISADLVPDEFKVRGYVPIAPAPFSEKLYKAAGIALQEDFCPLLSTDDIIRQLPETFLLTCEYDVLRDDGLLYKKRLEDNGVPVTWHHLKTGFHGIMYQNDCVPFQFKEAQEAMEHIVDFVQRC
ncbi:PREDICTED: arylacetamide deacetylase-like 3 [Gekko japonicus]|uniref:Arylacetamide deacetylase-like 3 n=1 Tax=Gekko japonicus TaxID=146911 RepID=A0ABM1KP11_GEKJA|nr:PREDICTED: arylacetamide deacetylase-like 3 [Gekko japonicus]